MVQTGHQVPVACIIQTNLECSFSALCIKYSADVLDLRLVWLVAFYSVHKILVLLEKKFIKVYVEDAAVKDVVPYIHSIVRVARLSLHPIANLLQCF